MKTVIGLAIAGTLLAGAANATTIVNPTTGSSDLILFVQDTNTHLTYARDLTTILVGTAFSVSSTGVNTSSALNTTITEDANLATFITAAGSDPLQWAVEGGQWTGASGAAQRPIGHRLIVTSIGGSGNPINVSETGVTQQMTNWGTDITNLNAFGNIGATGSTTETGTAATSGDGVWGTAAGVNGNQNWYGATPDTTGVLKGTSQALYGLTANGTSGGTALSYLLGTATLLSNGNLSFALTGTGAPVPLPAAIWLLGSGLLGLFGIGRRRVVTA
jgi:hypothetical protein